MITLNYLGSIFKIKDNSVISISGDNIEVKPLLIKGEIVTDPEEDLLITSLSKEFAKKSFRQLPNPNSQRQKIIAFIKKSISEGTTNYIDMLFKAKQEIPGLTKAIFCATAGEIPGLNRYQGIWTIGGEKRISFHKRISGEIESYLSSTPSKKGMRSIIIPHIMREIPKAKISTIETCASRMKNLERSNGIWSLNES